MNTINNFIYMIIPNERFNSKQPVVKIGKTSDFNRRIKQYPAKSKIINVALVDDCNRAERNLINKFDKIFKKRRDLGNEYFEGNVKIMSNVFNDVVNDKDCDVEYDVESDVESDDECDNNETESAEYKFSIERFINEEYPTKQLISVNELSHAYFDKFGFDKFPEEIVIDLKRSEKYGVKNINKCKYVYRI